MYYVTVLLLNATSDDSKKAIENACEEVTARFAAIGGSPELIQTCGDGTVTITSDDDGALVVLCMVLRQWYGIDCTVQSDVDQAASPPRPRDNQRAA